MSELQEATLYEQMFAAYGRRATQERIALYADTVGQWPIGVLQEGIRDAMRDVTDNPPGPGTVRRCCAAIARQRPGDPGPSHGGSRQGQIGAGPAVAQIVGGLAGRVPGMRKIFARALEIRRAGLVPPDLWGRFASETMAELETDPRAQVSAEMRRCMAHAREWREARGLSWSPPQGSLVPEEAA